MTNPEQPDRREPYENKYSPKMQRMKDAEKNASADLISYLRNRKTSHFSLEELQELGPVSTNDLDLVWYYMLQKKDLVSIETLLHIAKERQYQEEKYMEIFDLYFAYANHKNISPCSIFNTSDILRIVQPAGFSQPMAVGLADRFLENRDYVIAFSIAVATSLPQHEFSHLIDTTFKQRDFSKDDFSGVIKVCREINAPDYVWSLLWSLCLAKGRYQEILLIMKSTNKTLLDDHSLTQLAAGVIEHGEVLNLVLDTVSGQDRVPFGFFRQLLYKILIQKIQSA